MREFKADYISENYLHSYLHISYTEEGEYLILPDGADYIIFSSNDYIKIIEKVRSLEVLKIDNEELFLLRLKPYTLHLLRKNDLILKNELENLIPLLFDTYSIIKKKSYINEYLFSGKSFFKDIYIESLCINRIIQTKGDISVNQLAVDFDIPIRSLQRKFKKTTNLTPKEYINIIKFQSIITKIEIIKHYRFKKVPKMYTDYSHFYKEFKRYTTLSPKKFYKSELNHLRSIFDIY